MCGELCVPSATRPTRQQVATTSPGAQEVGGMCGPMNQLKRPKPQTTECSIQCQHGDAAGRPNRKTLLKHNENITDGHALCNVRSNDDSLENGSGSSLSFVFLERVVPDSCTKIAKCAH